MFAAALALVACPPATGAGTGVPPADDDSDRPVAGARLAWLSAEGIDLVGDAWADVPFRSRGRHLAFFAIDVRTTIEETTNDFDFVLRDIDYGAHLGWRKTPRRGPFGAMSVFVGQRGKALVDVAGDTWVRYVAVELQSRSFRKVNHPSWFEWNVGAGPVLDDRGIDADGWVTGSFRFDGPRTDSRPRAARIGFDVRVDGLWTAGGLEADWAGGPHLILPTGSGQSAVLFLHYQKSDNPLGLGLDTWLAGLEFVEDETAPEAGAIGPDVYAWIAAGLGDRSRLIGTLKLRALTPVFASHYRGVGTLEINALGGGAPDEADELFYRYDVGLERLFAAGNAGVYFYHRSNHLLAENGPGITSINVVEGGWESPVWYRVGTRDLDHRLGAFDYRVRMGYLIDSAFGEQRRWHARAAMRWTTPVGPGAAQLFLRVAIEDGDVASRAIALGIAASRRTEVEAVLRDDRQYFGASHAAFVNLRFAF